MILSQKKTCKGCSFEGMSKGNFCYLGFGINRNGIFSSVPSEPCYKPKTNSDESVIHNNIEIYKKATL